MGSPFDAAMRAADRTIDGVFGELFHVDPIADASQSDLDVNGPRRADSTRNPLPVTMTFQEVGDDYLPTARRVAGNAAQRLVGAKILLSVIDRNLPWQPREGDGFRRDKTGVIYRATKVEPDDAGRIWISVIVERAR
ncbi:hypothetical protein [Methylobacterium organophilum]|uniref:Phage protein n=1 Tax=Methylobacterium organophilum TaxID=410 RepID=A0ABQ4TD29_METOR|nr:hypothetical protein [Methylobacterium organophilum]GJE27952.1 hypothetical protein LKMONMHP_2814 [Methylobacterium organophilum]